MKYVIITLITPIVFIVGYILPGFIEAIPRGPGSNLLFYFRLVFAILLTAAALIGLARSLKLTRKQVLVSSIISVAFTAIVSGIVVYWLLLSVGGM